MFQALRRGGSAFVGMVGISLGVLLLPVAPADGRADPLVTAALVDLEAQGCNYYCRSCGENRHDIVTATTSNASSSHLENCNAGACDSHACSSALNAARVEHPWVAFQRASSREVAELLAMNHDVATLNQSRGAIQLRCQAGAIVASLPLAPGIIKDLAE